MNTLKRVLIVLVFVSWAGQVAAIPIVDQANEPPLPGAALTGALYRGQVFTVGIAGVLTGFEVFLSSPVDGNASDFEIWNVAGGMPDPIPGNPLAAGTISFDSGQGFAFLDISSFNLNVLVGDVLAIVQIGRSTLQRAEWRASSNGYAGGNGYTTTVTDPTGSWIPSPFDLDYGFRTYVDEGSVAVPAPATLALSCLGLAGLGWSRRRKA